MTKNREGQWKTAFDVWGYVHIQNWLAGRELSNLEDQVNRFIREIAPGLPREHVFHEDRSDPSTLKQIQQMGIHDEYFGNWLNRGRLRELAEMLLDGPVEPVNMQYFSKPPGVGMPTPAHQDGFYFMLEPCSAVTMWLALDAIDETNGCIRYVPGSHRKGMRPHARTQTLGFSQGITDFAQDDLQAESAAVVHPGDLLVHHALTIHRADANQSLDRPRRALGLAYYAENAAVDEKAHRAYQQRLQEEMIEAGKI